MQMERTISEIFPGRIYLGGPSANRFWNIPFALKSLCGEIEAAQILIQAHEPLLNYRLVNRREALTELGIATTCVVTTSFIVERSIKTLIAQTNPKEKPWSRKDAIDGHDLNGLFRRRLDPVDQAAVQHQLETLPSFWNHYAETNTVEGILDIASNSFLDWRYAMEPREVKGGVPKSLLKVAVSVTLVGIDRLNQWQVSNQISAPTNDQGSLSIV